METEEIINIISNDENVQESIGTKQEKTIHQFLKYYISPDSKNHEVKVGKNIVDVLLDNHVYEIQTRNFNTLRDKLNSLLVDYKVTIVYPVESIKMLYKTNELGEVIQKHKSPRPDRPIKICSELYKISDYLNNPNLSFMVACLDVDEYQTTRINKYKQTRLTRIDASPNKVIETIELNNSSDFLKILPDLDLFTSKDFSKATKLTGRNLSSALLALRKLNVIDIDHKEGNKYIYKIKDIL